MHKDENGDLVLTDEDVKDFRAKGIMPMEHIYFDAMAENQGHMDVDQLNNENMNGGLYNGF